MVIIIIVNIYKYLGFEVKERKTIVLWHLRGNFILDCIINIPIALCKYTSKERYYSDLMNIITFNYGYIPRLYTILLSAKLLRIRKMSNMQFKLFRKLGLSIKISHICITLLRLFIIIHLIACFWVAASKFDTSTNKNWMVP